MPNTQPVNDNATVTSYIIARARRNAVVNIYPIGASPRTVPVKSLPKSAP
jgi:dihydroorotase